MTNLIIQVLDYKKGDEHRTISIRMSEKHIKELEWLVVETNQSETPSSTNSLNMVWRIM